MPEVDVRSEPGRVSRQAALIACVQAATAAPSVHNSQPWRFRIRDGGIDVLADWSRRLEVIDPSGRELLISVGAAVFNVRVAVRQSGQLPLVRLLPEPTEPDLVARVTPGWPAPPTAAVEALAAVIPRRHTNRRPFARAVIPADVLTELAAAATVEETTLTVAGAVARGAILSLARTAEQRLRSRGFYRAELAHWTLPARHRHDGVPPQAFGPWDALETLPLRDFGLTQPHLTAAAKTSNRIRPSPYSPPTPTARTTGCGPARHCNASCSWPPSTTSPPRRSASRWRSPRYASLSPTPAGGHS